ncbi:glycosyltransferase family 2 protein [Paenibacillus albidus]|uniref:glycosyltransferase n=1 Tax=Paenibacillus albidus TaxID=2041023 RepID=UPI001BE57889|nr:glycosyltransferase [Paenibacillus albidus]MBT2291614.1 glycosyltransferase family 2 protein [Paenibacillus albidus]
MQKTSIIMTVFPKQLEYMKASIDSIRRFTKKGSYELIVVESGGSLETRNWLAEETEIRSLFFDQELTMSQALNEGIYTSNYDSILIMHEDTLVTENWLELLSEELYKSKNIGAVGPLTNFSDDGQADAVQFSSMEELLTYAKGISEMKSVELRLTLSGFCLLFKRSVMETTGILDEQLDGDISIIDFCLRIKKNGYKLGLCRHVYVHHYGINEICTDKNYQKSFKSKWGYNIEDIKTESNVLKLLVFPIETAFKILVVGLLKGGSATALKLRQMYPNSEVEYYCIDQISNSLIHEKFDYIILNSKIHYEETLALMKEMLTDQGQVLVELFNINFFGVVRRLLLGEGLEDERRYWKVADIVSLFEEAGFQELDFEYVFDDNLQEQDNSFIAGLGNLVEELPQEFRISSFLVSARMVPKNELLHGLFDELLQTYSDDVLSDILRFPTTQIISSIDSYDGFVVSLLNYLGISNFDRKKLDDVLPYLVRAYELETDNSFTLINLATVMHSLGDDERALGWLESIGDKSEHVNEWISKLKKTIYDERLAETKIKFLLRRIENDVEREDAAMELIALLQQNGVSTNQVIDIVMVDIVDKIGTFNRIAINCFNAGLYEAVIPLLERSYAVNPENDDTLFNLGYMLFKFGAFNEGLDFVKKIREPNDDVLRLQQDIEECMNHGYK